MNMIIEYVLCYAGAFLLGVLVGFVGCILILGKSVQLWK